MIAVKWRYFDDGSACRPARIESPGAPESWVHWERNVAPGVWEPCETPPPPERWFRITEAGLVGNVSLFADDGASSPDDTGSSGEGPVQRVLRVPSESRSGRILTPAELALEVEFCVAAEAERVRQEVALMRSLRSGEWKPAAMEAARSIARQVPKCQHCGPDHLH